MIDLMLLYLSPIGVIGIIKPYHTLHNLHIRRIELLDKLNLVLIRQNVKLESGVHILILILSSLRVKGVLNSKVVELFRLGVNYNFEQDSMKEAILH